MPTVQPSEDAYQAALRLRAVRQFLDEPIAEADLARILEAGRWTGSSKNSQPWALVVVEDAEQRKRVAAAGRFAAPVKSAPLAVVLVRLPKGTDFDIGRLAQNMMLAAAGLGIGSVPVTLHNEKKARDALRVPDSHGCRYAVAFGYVDEQARRSAMRASSWIRGGRKPLDEIVRRERFDSA